MDRIVWMKTCWIDKERQALIDAENFLISTTLPSALSLFRS